MDFRKKNNLNEQVNLQGLQEFVAMTFNVKLSDASASNFFHKNGFASKTLKSKLSGYIINTDNLASIMLEWLQETAIDFPKDRIALD